MKKFTLLAVSCFFLAATFSSQAQNPKKFYKVGTEFLENRKYQDAIDQFSKAIEADPDYENAYASRAEVYEKVKEYAKAAEDYEKLAIFDPKNEELFLQRGTDVL